MSEGLTDDEILLILAPETAQKHGIRRFSLMYTAIAVQNVTLPVLPHRYGNSHAIWDHTMLPAILQS